MTRIRTSSTQQTVGQQPPRRKAATPGSVVTLPSKTMERRFRSNATGWVPLPNSARMPTALRMEQAPLLLAATGPFYRATQEGCTPRAIARLEATADRDLVWWSDHTESHCHDVIAKVRGLAAVAERSGLIQRRPPERHAFLCHLGDCLAALHDIWMKDLTPAGRSLHAARAGREVFSANFSAAADALAFGSFGRQLQAVYGIPPRDVRRVVRELLSLAATHSKTEVPREALDEPAALRGTMQRILRSAEDGDGGDVLRHYGGSPERLDAAAFDWVLDNRALAQDAVDACRVVRTADALRVRGPYGLRGGAGGLVGWTTIGGRLNVLSRLRDSATGKTYLVRYEGDHMVGELNIQRSGLNHRGELVFELTTHTCGAPKLDQALAEMTALAAADVDDDYRGSFGDRVQNMPLWVHRPPDDAVGFTERVVEAMCCRSPELAFRNQRGLIRIVDTAPETAWALAVQHPLDRAEKIRFDSAPAFDRSRVSGERIRRSLEEAGMDVSSFDLTRAFDGARLVTLGRDEYLMVRGTEPQFVYVPLDEGLCEVRAGLAERCPAPPFVPIGEVSASSGLRRAEDVIVASGAPRVIAIPRETYLKEWTGGIYTPATILPRLKQDFA